MPHCASTSKDRFRFKPDIVATKPFVLSLQFTIFMNLPKFVLADNSQFPDDLFVIHLDYPRFIINLTNDEVEIFDDVDDEDQAELEAEMEALIQQAGEFYDAEMEDFE